MTSSDFSKQIGLCLNLSSEPRRPLDFIDFTNLSISIPIKLSEKNNLAQSTLLITYLGINEPPIYAHCDFQNSQTIIGFESINTKVTIPHCRGPFCFQHIFKYGSTMGPAPISQLEELVKLSGDCYQQISFDCRSAPFKVSQSYVEILIGWVLRIQIVCWITKTMLLVLV